LTRRAPGSVGTNFIFAAPRRVVLGLASDGTAAGAAGAGAREEPAAIGVGFEPLGSDISFAKEGEEVEEAPVRAGAPGDFFALHHE
jgi:hypothetical protein